MLTIVRHCRIVLVSDRNKTNNGTRASPTTKERNGNMKTEIKTSRGTKSQLELNIIAHRVAKTEIRKYSNSWFSFAAIRRHGGTKKYEAEINQLALLFVAKRQKRECARMIGFNPLSARLAHYKAWKNCLKKEIAQRAELQASFAQCEEVHFSGWRWNACIGYRGRSEHTLSWSGAPESAPEWLVECLTECIPGQSFGEGFQASLKMKDGTHVQFLGSLLWGQNATGLKLRQFPKQTDNWKVWTQKAVSATPCYGMQSVDVTKFRI